MMQRQPSVMTHLFSQAPTVGIPRSSFDRSHGLKTTFSSGYLVPIYVDEALPGDSFNLNMTGLCRLATPIFPLMDNLYLDTMFFAVPYRLVWDNWEKFNGAQDNPGDSTDYVIPTMSSDDYTPAGYPANSIHDHMGLPVGMPNIKNSCLWHRAYHLIWNQWFRDENLQDQVLVKKDNGPDDAKIYNFLKRGKRPDYFTSALPWPQKGPGVQIPLGGRANVMSASFGDGVNPSDKAPYGYTNGSVPTGSGPYSWTDQGAGQGGIWADLSTATAATINTLRQAAAIQQIYEQDARGGTRYVEILRSFFKVVSPDFRLQRPELLSTHSTPIIIAPVPQTGGTGANVDTPQGNLAAYGIALANGHGFTHSFTEHCLLIGLACVRADLTYQQGLERMWSRKTRFDFYWPPLDSIGEQTILSKEIYADGTANDELVFGYQERYADYRYKPSKIVGEFRSSFPQSLDVWHLSQDFATRPVLDSAFIEENPPVGRVIAVPSEPQFIADFYFGLRCARPMPVYSIPGLRRF